MYNIIYKSFDEEEYPEGSRRESVDGENGWRAAGEYHFGAGRQKLQ